MKIAILDHPRPLSVEHYNDVANAPLSSSLNTGYAYSVLKEAGCEVGYLDFHTNPQGQATMANAVIAEETDILLLHWVYNWDDAKIISDLFKCLRQKSFGGKIGAFGLFPSFCGDRLLKHNHSLDFVLVGEFEATLQELARDNFCIGKRPGVLTKEGYGGARPLIEDLSTLPFPQELGKTSQLSHLNITGSRGCYGNCTFCFIHPFYGCSKWRGRSIESITSELAKRLAKRAEITNKDDLKLYFCDPNFFGPGDSGQERAIELAKGLKKFDIKFGIEARVNDIKSASIKALKKSGLESVFLGIESASPDVLKRMKKGITPKQSERAIKILRDNDIFVAVGFIMFEPDSTLEDLRLNYDFLEDNGLLANHDISANVLYHNQIVIKGTPGYRKLMLHERVIHSKQTPYEAKVTYLNPEVATISRAMGQITLYYFQNMDRIWREHASEQEQFESCHLCEPEGLPGEEINNLLKESFLTFLEKVESGSSDITSKVELAITNLEELFRDDSSPTGR